MQDTPSFPERPPASPPVAPPTGPQFMPPATAVEGLAGSAPMPPAPSMAASSMAAGPVRPWWGIGDVWLAIPFVIVASIVGTLIAVLIELVGSGNLDALTAEDFATTPSLIIIGGLFAQQGAQFVWPFIVSKWKGLGAAIDWRFTFKPIDILIGIGAFVGCFIASAAAAYGVGALLNIDEPEGNTQILENAEGSPWLYAMMFAVVIGAPFSEEVLFRGLILRAFEKRAGTVVGVVASTVLFTVIHFNMGAFDANAFQQQLILWASIGLVGLILALVAVKTNRLWPCIIAHIAFNGVGTALALLEV